MKRQEIIDKLKYTYTMICAPENDIDTLTEEADLRTDLGLSSIGMLYLVIAVEETFNIRFDDVQMGSFVTVKDVVDFIERKVA